MASYLMKAADSYTGRRVTLICDAESQADARNHLKMEFPGRDVVVTDIAIISMISLKDVRK
jgi:hypothetical protein